MSEPVEGQVRVWYIPQVPMDAFEFDVPDLAAGKLVLDALSAFSWFEYQNDVKPDYADAGGIHSYEADGSGGFDWFEVDESEYEDE